jgi:hypothetical protein
VGQNRTVGTCAKDHTQTCLPITNDDVVDIHVAFLHFIEHKMAKNILATHSNECHFQAKPGCTAGKDG